MNKDLEKIIKEIECYQNEDMCLIMLSQKENKALLDYITNLQQENEDNLKCIKNLKEQLESVIKNNQELLEKWHKNNDKIVNLISENERLKENNGNMQEEMARTWKKCADYKSRLEKGIEYIKNNMQYDDNIDDNWVMTNDLLNILQNGSDSQ